MARPKINIDWKRFESYCAVQCTLQEIADYFDCSQMTIERKVKEHYNCCFVDVFKRKRQVGLMSLRANLFKLSGKHPVMAIFLAKNWLGMKDVSVLEGGDKDKPIRSEITVVSTTAKKLLTEIEKGEAPHAPDNNTNI